MRVVSKLRSFQGKSSFTCLCVSPLQDLNELTHHFLEAIYVHCYNTKGSVGKADVAMTSVDMSTKAVK